MLNKQDLNHKIDMLLNPERPTLDLLRDLGFDMKKLKKEIKVRLLFKLGLLPVLNISEFAIIFNCSKSWALENKDSLGFRKISGSLKFPVHNTGFLLSGRLEGRDARRVEKKKVAG